ncbi:lysophospholipid acyltransferase family protein [uncultured Tateyamaria sp.]|uniref:lysophospholipid acyltransferase family protein n=1 Tax=Tateyamaria sp. 1078 TaxID=3417464 RepID=UPI0026036B62|nr:lysophospholipid acyltransferase family protein [uncultured Tateyamaria sp.]
MLQLIRSTTFVGQIYVMMLVIGLVFAPYAIISRHGARAACKSYSRYVFWTMRWWVGIRAEVRGEVPQGEVLIAAKHQSFLDIMMIFTALPSAKFIMKRSILWTPIIGLYAKRLECVPVDRGKRGAAIAKMVEDVEAGRANPGQLIIYSQGTRVAPGVKAPYKVGTAVLYEQLGQPCVPVATNVGVLWPRTGLRRTPGLAVVEFLPAIEPGMEREAFLAHLEDVVETRSDALMRELGYDPHGVH